MNPLLTSSATHLARLIRDREATSREVVEAHIAQVERVNGALNAVVRTRFDEARAEAGAVDLAIAEDPSATRGPFYGVPCTIKECFAFTGMPNTSGLVARKGLIATEDATAVARLRGAGAIPLGVTNVSELCMWMETNNRVYGRTNNPYDTTRIVGGSSGGEGAIVGAGGSPFGLGSDVGGSIRGPAFFNGVFGHKPTGGLVPATGQYPIAENAALRYLVTGPLTRRAEDLMPLLRVLAGPDGRDAGCQQLSLGDPNAVDLGAIRLLDVDLSRRSGFSADLLDASLRVKAHLASLGAKVEAHRFDKLAKSVEIWSALLDDAGGQSFSQMLGNGSPIRGARELARWALRASEHTLPAIVLALIESVPKLAKAQATRFVEEGIELRRSLHAALAKDGVMLYPPYATTAPRHYKPLLLPIHWGHFAIFNVMELPVTQVPLGLDKNGLPLGVQVVAGHGQDHVSIAVALELQKAFGGWVPPKAMR